MTSFSGSATTPATDLYACPRTGQRLRIKGDALVSEDGAAYHSVRGIPNFLRYPASETSDVNNKLDRVNQLARQSGWEQAAKEVYGDWKYIQPSGRDAWMELLPLDPRATVLEIGPGMGQFTPIISRRCARLCALEVVPGQAEFVDQRCRQQGCDNVEVACGGDDCRLPYAPDTFDLVIMNLVFEWCSTRDEADADLAAGQRRMLTEINRVLKPGGTLYLLTKNRYALRLLLGKHDEHVYKMRWGNALPRPLMRLALKVHGHERPRGVLHSHNALKRMLHQAGFSRTTSYWAAPEMRYPCYCVPTDAETVRRSRRQPGFVQGEFRSTRLLMPLVPAPFVKHLTPGLQFVAEK